MRPENNNNISGKSSWACLIIISKQQLNIIMLLTWCGWHDQVYAILLTGWLKRDKKYCHRGGRKGCHGNDPKMMQRNISVPVTRWESGAKGKMAWASQTRWKVGWSRHRVPTGRRRGNRGARQKMIRARSTQEKHLIQHKQTFSGHRLGVIPSEHRSRRVRGRRGSSRSRDS